MLLSAQGKRSNPLLANLLAKPSTAGPASGGKGQPKRKAKAPPASDGPDSAPDGAPPSTPDRRAPPGHPNGTPIGIVVEKVVARSSFAKASRRSTAAGPTAGTRASVAPVAPTHEGTLVPSPGLVPNGGADGLASASEVHVAGEDVVGDTVEDAAVDVSNDNLSTDGIEGEDGHGASDDAHGKDEEVVTIDDDDDEEDEEDDDDKEDEEDGDDAGDEGGKKTAEGEEEAKEEASSDDLEDPDLQADWKELAPGVAKELEKARKLLVAADKLAQFPKLENSWIVHCVDACSKATGELGEESHKQSTVPGESGVT